LEKAASFYGGALRMTAVSESLQNLRRSIYTQEGWANRLFNDYKLFPIIGADEKTIKLLTEAPLWRKLLEPILQRANITTIINSLTGISLINSSQGKSLIQETDEIIKAHQEAHTTLTKKMADIYEKTDNDGYAFSNVKNDYAPARGLKGGNTLYKKINNINEMFVTVRGIINKQEKILSVSDASVGKSIATSKIEWVLADLPYFAMGHQEFTSGILLLDIDSSVLEKIETFLPFYRDVGWYPYAQVSGYIRYPHSPSHGYPSIKVSWVEYRPPKHPDDIRDILIRAYTEPPARFATRSDGSRVQKDNEFELREFLDTISIVAHGVDLNTKDLADSITKIINDVEKQLSIKTQ
jgi:hypothetical protein